MTHLHQCRDNLLFSLLPDDPLVTIVLLQITYVKPRLKYVQGVEDVGHEEVEECPELGQVVLKWCARQQ